MPEWEKVAVATGVAAVGVAVATAVYVVSACVSHRLYVVIIVYCCCYTIKEYSNKQGERRK